MSKKILILEDDKPVAELISFFLEEEGYITEITHTGKEFLDKVIDFKPDLITLDVLLPDIDGFKVFKTLAQDKRTREIPVVFVTVKESEKERGVSMGAVGYIAKPFKEQELKDAVKSILQKE